MAWIRGMLKIGLLFLINQAIADQIKVIDLSKSYYVNRTEVNENHNTSSLDPHSKTSLDYYGHNENEKCKKVSSDSDLNDPVNQAIVLLGGSSRGNGPSPFALTSRSICPDDIIPQLPSTTSASFAAFVENCIVVCGGRENTLQLNNECWKYNLTTHLPKNEEHEEELKEGGLWKEWKKSFMWKAQQKSWEQISSLPSPLAGSAVTSFNEKIWVFGGLVEEDYYDTKTENEYYYYDYVVEVAGHGVNEYDPKKNQWNVIDANLPKEKIGSCAVVHDDSIFLIGGKGHLEDLNGSDEIWEFDPIKLKWHDNYTWPRMKRERYYHGCTVGFLEGEKGIFAVGGRGDEYNNGKTAEFLPFKPSKGSLSWKELPYLQKPHPNMPGVSYMDGMLFVVAGGGPPFVGGEKTIEVFDGFKWSSFEALNQDKVFAASVNIPDKWFDSCKMEPNLGIHQYHQKKTNKMLSGKQWLCNGDRLQMSDQEKSPVIGGCTIPGCYYPHFFSHHVNASVIKSMRVRGGRLSCQHMDIGTPLSRIECRLKCKKGWENANDIDVTVCTKSQVEALARIKNLTSDTSQTHRALHQKTTNFTTDYLECHRRISLTSPSYHESTTSSIQTHFDKTLISTTQEPPSTYLDSKYESISL